MSETLSIEQGLALWLVGVLVVGAMVLGRKMNDRVRAKIAKHRNAGKAIPRELISREKAVGIFSGLAEASALIFAVIVMVFGFFLGK